MWPYLGKNKTKQNKSRCRWDNIQLGRSTWGCHGLSQVGPRANRKQRGWDKARECVFKLRRARGTGSPQKPQVAWKGATLTASRSREPARTFSSDASRPMSDYISVLTNHSGCGHPLCQLALLHHTERKSGLPAVDSGNSFRACLPLRWAPTGLLRTLLPPHPPYTLSLLFLTQRRPSLI